MFAKMKIHVVVRAAALCVAVVVSTAAFAASAAAQEVWFYTSANNSETCRTEIAIPERKAGFSLVRTVIEGREFVGMGLFFHDIKHTPPLSGFKHPSTAKVDEGERFTLGFMKTTRTELGTLVYMTDGPPSEVFLRQLMSGSEMHILVNPWIGRVDISLAGSRAAIQGWIECVEQGRKSAGEGRGLAIYQERKLADRGAWFADRSDGSTGVNCNMSSLFVSDVFHILGMRAIVSSNVITRGKILLIGLEAKGKSNTLDFLMGFEAKYRRAAPDAFKLKWILDDEEFIEIKLNKVDDPNGPAYLANISANEFIQITKTTAGSQKLSLVSTGYFSADIDLEGYEKALFDMNKCVTATN